MSDGTGLVEALLGLAGFRVLALTETPAEVVIDLESTAELEGCARCGTRAAMMNAERSMWRGRAPSPDPPFDGAQRAVRRALEASVLASEERVSGGRSPMARSTVRPCAVPGRRRAIALARDAQGAMASLDEVLDVGARRSRSPIAR